MQLLTRISNGGGPDRNEILTSSKLLLDKCKHIVVAKPTVGISIIGHMGR